MRRLGAEDIAIEKKLASIEERRKQLAEEAQQLAVQRAELQPKIDEAKKRVQDCIKGRIDPTVCVMPTIDLPDWAQYDLGMQAVLASLQVLANNFQEAHRTFFQQIAAAEARKQEASAATPASSIGGPTPGTAEEEEMDLDLGLEISHAGFADMASQMQFPESILQQISDHCAQQGGQTERPAGEDGPRETVASRRQVKLKTQDGLLKTSRGASDTKAINPKEAERAAKLAAAGVVSNGVGVVVPSRGSWLTRVCSRKRWPTSRVASRDFQRKLLGNHQEKARDHHCPPLGSVAPAFGG